MANVDVRYPASTAADTANRFRLVSGSSWGALVLGTLLGLLLIVVGLGPMLWPESATEQHAAIRLQGPSVDHPLGTDQFGRDTAARVLAGGRWTVLGAAGVTAGVTVIGLLVAIVASSSARALNITVNRLIDSLLAVPNLVIALGLAAVLGPSFFNLMVALIAAGWPWYARAYRAAVLKEQVAGYVEGAEVLGASRLRIAVRHIGPNIAGQAMVLATTNLGFVMLNLAALSFVGLGVQPPTPEWGSMINEARPFFQSHPVQMLVPGMCIAVSVILVNLAGDALRDRLDPRTSDR